MMFFTCTPLDIAHMIQHTTQPPPPPLPPLICIAINLSNLLSKTYTQNRNLHNPNSSLRREIVFTYSESSGFDTFLGKLVKRH